MIGYNGKADINRVFAKVTKAVRVLINISVNVDKLAASALDFASTES